MDSIPLGAHVIAAVDDCILVPVTIDGQNQTITIGVGSGIFVLLVGVTLNFIAIFFSLLTLYASCGLFGKCQTRRWKVLHCIGIPLGICTILIVVGTIVYSIFVGVSFYPLTQQEFEVPYCCRIPYYSTFIFILIAHVLTSVVTTVFLIIVLIMCVFVLIRCTICS